MRILALHNSHNASICEINNGNIVYFQEAERLDKSKKSDNWPILLNKYSNQNFDKIIFITTKSLNEKNHVDDIKKSISTYNIEFKKLKFEINHHFFHACSGFFNSGFKNSYVLVIDGNGSGNCFNNKKCTEIVSLYYFKKNKFKEIFKVFQSNENYSEGKHVFINTLSLGNMYSFVKNILKFKEEGSVMGLSSYEKHVPNFPNFFVKNDFNHFTSNQGLIHDLHKSSYTTMKNISQFVCKAVQTELEEIVKKYITNIVKKKNRNICVSGGVFQNTVLNSKIIDICPNLYVDPFADDSGLSMGAALWYSNKNKFKGKKINSLYLGDLPNYNDLPKDKGIRVTEKEVAKYIAKGNIVAIYQGKNELGKRSLGNRSFLYDPRDQYAKEKINLLKGREWFRPVAGTVLHEHAEKWFDLKSKKETPFMSYVFKVKKQGVPGITHIDNTCRIQTLKKQENFHYYNLINEFYKLTKIPILLNTSFNLAGDPLVNDVYDAIKTLTNCLKKFNVIYFPEIGKIYSIEDFS
tara:strand:+ start:49 stop:1611 length:1563 start_codon:yes stop_codon:yes gene_type:complete